MLKIDSHQHFWVYDPVRDSWINDEMAILQDDFLPAHLQPILEHYGFQGSVVVQSDQSREETLFQLDNADKYAFVKGVVGWVDLLAPDLTQQLQEYKKYDKLKGFRLILQAEQPEYIMLPELQSGIQKLADFGYTYDILVYGHQLEAARKMASGIEGVPFVLDHIGKPDIKILPTAQWKQEIRALASQQNVYCKVSGMVTEADIKNWKTEDFKPFLDHIFESFGAQRVMFGSDWPVCRLAATYGQVLGIMEHYMSSFSKNEQDLFWGDNAAQFYGLS